MPTQPQQPYQYGAPTPATPPPKRRVRPLSIVLAVVGVLGCFGGLIVATSNGTSNTNTGPPVPPGVATGTSAAKAVPVPASGIPARDGVFLVPTEAKAGTYRAVVPADSFDCYWARLKGTSGDFNDILANDDGEPGQRMTVTIEPTDKAFETRGCGDWSRIG